MIDALFGVLIGKFYLGEGIGWSPFLDFLPDDGWYSLISSTTFVHVFFRD